MDDCLDGLFVMFMLVAFAFIFVMSTVGLISGVVFYDYPTKIVDGPCYNENNELVEGKVCEVEVPDSDSKFVRFLAENPRENLVAGIIAMPISGFFTFALWKSITF